MDFIVTITMRLITASVLLLIISYLAYILLKNKNEYFQTNRYSLVASFVLGLSWIFVPIVLQRNSNNGFSWGSLSTLLQAFSLFGILFYGISGFLLGNFFIRIAKNFFFNFWLNICWLIIKRTKRRNIESIYIFELNYISMGHF